MNAKYLPLALLLSCTPPAKKIVPPEPVPMQPDCSSVDLIQKVGFSTSFMNEGERFCYRIASQENHYYDIINKCDKQGKLLPEQNAVIMREFAGPRKGSMEIKAILTVSGNSMEYIPFLREPSGEISTLPFVTVPKEIGRLFDAGKNMLDQAKYIPEVCQELLKYKPNH